MPPVNGVMEAGDWPDFPVRYGKAKEIALYMLLKTLTFLVLTLSIACGAESLKRPYKYSEELVKKAESGDVEAQNDVPYMVGIASFKYKYFDIKTLTV